MPATICCGWCDTISDAPALPTARWFGAVYLPLGFIQHDITFNCSKQEVAEKLYPCAPSPCWRRAFQRAKKTTIFMTLFIAFKLVSLHQLPQPFFNY